MVTVQQLIRLLQTLPADAKVVLQADPEGNWFADMESFSQDDKDSPVVLIPYWKRRDEP